MSSEDMQNRYCAEATKDDYILPDEIIDQAISSCNLCLSKNTDNSILNSSEEQAVKNFLLESEKYCDLIPQEVDFKEIVNSDAWVKLRDAAKSCLIVLSN